MLKTLLTMMAAAILSLKIAGVTSLGWDKVIIYFVLYVGAAILYGFMHGKVMEKAVEQVLEKIENSTCDGQEQRHMTVLAILTLLLRRCN